MVLCERSISRVNEGGPPLMVKESLVSTDFKCFRKGVLGWGGGPLMMVKDSLFLLISNILGRGCGAGEGAHQ